LSHSLGLFSFPRSFSLSTQTPMPVSRRKRIRENLGPAKTLQMYAQLHAPPVQNAELCLSTHILHCKGVWVAGHPCQD
jgi:hypothetical protein